MKLVGHLLETIAGISTYPIISLLIFFILFSSVLVIVFRTDKRHVQKMSTLPFENDEAYDGKNEQTTVK